VLCGERPGRHNNILMRAHHEEHTLNVLQPRVAEVDTHDLRELLAELNAAHIAAAEALERAFAKQKERIRDGRYIALGLRLHRRSGGVYLEWKVTHKAGAKAERHKSTNVKKARGVFHYEPSALRDAMPMVQE